MSKDDFFKYLEEALKDTKDKPPCMSLYVSEDGLSVELVLDTSKSYYGDWIEGEGGDIALLRDRDTDKVVGCHLPLYQKKLVVGHTPGIECEVIKYTPGAECEIKRV